MGLSPFPAPLGSVCVLCDVVEGGRVLVTVDGEDVAVASLCLYHYDLRNRPDVRGQVLAVVFSVLEGRVA